MAFPNGARLTSMNQLLTQYDEVIMPIIKGKRTLLIPSQSSIHTRAVMHAGMVN